MNKILYVILHTCKRPERYDGVVNSWGKDVDFLFYSDCDDNDKKIIKVSDDSTYSSNETKHVNVIKHLGENDYQYEWFFFCDDDTFVNTKNLENRLDSFDKEKIHGNITKTWRTDPQLEYCSGGAGYLIHNSILKKLSESISVRNTGYSDVTVGLYAKELNISFENHDGFYSQDPKYHNVEKTTIKDVFTFHYISPKDMDEFYQLIQE